MANVEFNPVVEGTKGALSKGGLIPRQWTNSGGREHLNVMAR